MSTKPKFLNARDHANVILCRLPLEKCLDQERRGFAYIQRDRKGQPLELHFKDPAELNRVGEGSDARLSGGQKLSYLEKSKAIPRGVWRHAGAALLWRQAVA